jgi:hypothetical protein
MVGFTTLKLYQPGSPSPGSPFIPGWNLVARDFRIPEYRGGLLFYNAITGAAATADVSWPDFISPDQPGQPVLQLLQDYPAGSRGPLPPHPLFFNVGWTHIVPTVFGLFYYNASDGSAALGRIDWSTPHFGKEGNGGTGAHCTIRHWNAGAFRRHWSRIAGGTDMLFYDAQYGSGAVGGLDINAGFKFTTFSTLEAGAFATGWTDIVKFSVPIDG